MRFRKVFGIFGRHFLAALALGLLVAVPAQATTLDYDAFVGSRKIGEAEVTVAVRDSEYEISGRAHAVGLTRFFTKWRSLFRAKGFFGAAGPQAEEYRLEERLQAKSKEIFLENGQVNYFKNGKPKRVITPPASPDLLTALFAAPDCHASNTVHNGKDLWSITLIDESQDQSSGAKRCAFSVVDEDDEMFTATVWFNDMGGLLLPVRLEFDGSLQASLQLRNEG